MTEEHIIWWAQEAGSSLGINADTPGYLSMFKRFAEQVAEHERKACIKIVETEMDEWVYDGKSVNVALSNVVADIEARGE